MYNCWLVANMNELFGCDRDSTVVYDRQVRLPLIPVRICPIHLNSSMRKINFFLLVDFASRQKQFIAGSYSGQYVEKTKDFLPSIGRELLGLSYVCLVISSLLVASISCSTRASAQSEIRCSTASLILSKDISKMHLGEKTKVTSYIDGKRSFFESPPKSQAMK